MLRLALVVLGLAACDTGSGDALQPLGDAPPGTPMCTGAVYDTCAMPSHCMSQMCNFYNDSNFQACTQTCSTSNPCPNDSAGMPGTCNRRGLCKPSKATLCVP